MKILRSFLIPAQTGPEGVQLAMGGGLQGNVVSWLGAAMTPQGILVNTVCEEAAAPIKTSLVLPGGAGRSPEKGAQKWLFQVVGDGSPVPEPVRYRRLGDAVPALEEPQFAGAIGNLFIYVVRDRRDEPGVEVVKPS